MTDPRAYDEMVDGRGGVRAHWRPVLAAFADVGGGGLVERARRLDEVFEEEGGTSLRPAGGQGGWRCDPVPLPLPAGEFSALAAGLAQRARLLQAILADLYGPQELVRHGLLPPALVFANPGFLRPRREWMPGGGQPNAEHPPLLHCYAADLVRGSDGAWRVLADRLTDPGGIGYAHENRRLLARVLPEAFRPASVRQLRPFFDIWQDALQRLAPHGSANPGIALLTPGAGEAGWFEQMLLARELSCALVESGDLTVRAGRLFLKTLRGLQPIDVLLSRVPGALADPLELAARGAQGVSGLLEALRHGAVRMVNDPGVGLLETPALAAFLPALADRLLGESLRLDGAPVLWLGDAVARDRAQGDPARWTIRAAFDGPDPVEDPAPALAEAPWSLVATETPATSTAPCAGARGLEPRPIVLRLFLAFDGAEWRVMPGGVARALDEGASAQAGLAAPGLAKDVWVLNEEQGIVIGPPPLPQLPLAIRRTTGDLPGRVAENFFWLGRYLERLEGGARLVRIALARLGRDGGMPRDLAALEMLTGCLIEADLVPAETDIGVGSEVLREALLASVRERGALAELVNDVTRLTDVLRDRLTADMYSAFVHTLREALDDLRQIESEPGWRNLELLGRTVMDIIRFTATVSGLAAENMVQGGGRLFLDLGRRTERAHAVTAIIARVLDHAADQSRVGVIEDRLRLILELCDSAITYRNRYLTVLQAGPVLDLVIADGGNPRGLAFQLAAIRNLLMDVVGVPEGGLAEVAGALLEDAAALPERVAWTTDQVAGAASLAGPLRSIGAGIAELSDGITRRYFALLPVRQFVGTDPPSLALRGAA